MNPMSEAGPDADRPPPGRLRGWLGGRTLRGQLIVGLVSLLALACAGVGIVTYVVLSHTGQPRGQRVTAAPFRR